MVFCCCCLFKIKYIYIYISEIASPKPCLQFLIALKGKYHSEGEIKRKIKEENKRE